MVSVVEAFTGLRLLGLGLVVALMACRSTPRESAANDREQSLAVEVERRASLAGRVLDVGGAPLANVEVCLRTSLFEPDSLGGRPWGVAQCVDSGSDGRYRFEDLEPARVLVSAGARGVSPASWSRGELSSYRDELCLEPGESREDIDLQLRAEGVPVRGIVRDELGEPLAGVSVTMAGGVLRSRAPWIATTSDAEGRFELWGPSGPVSLLAASEGRVRAQAEFVAPAEALELTLYPGSTLAGIVVDSETSQPIAEATLVVRKADVFGDPRLQGVVRARTDGAGGFEIEGLRPGFAYTLEAIADHHRVADERTFIAGYGQTIDDIELRAAPGHVVEGSLVVASTGEACGRGWAKAEGQLRYADEHGRVRLRALPAGTITIRYGCLGHLAQAGQAEVDVRGDVGGLRWAVERRPGLQGEVVDGEGAPVGDVRVFALATQHREDTIGKMSALSHVTDADGRFEFGELASGGYDLRIDSGRWQDPQPQVIVQLGEVEVEGIRLVVGPRAPEPEAEEEAPTGTIRGRVVDDAGQPVAGALISHGEARFDSVETLRRAMPLSPRFSAADGSFVIEGLAEGSHNLVATQLGGRQGWASGVEPGLDPVELRITAR